MEANAGGSVASARPAYHHAAPAAITATAPSASHRAARDERGRCPASVTDCVRPRRVAVHVLLEETQVGAQVLRRLIALLGILREAAPEHTAEVARQVGSRSVTDAGVSLMIADSIDMLVSPLNGRCPVAIS